jgi:hypothetical protein
MNILLAQKCGSKPLTQNRLTMFNCNGKWCRFFIKIGGEEHLNKRKTTNELSHAKRFKSTMIGAM